jgi:tetratricopeptide (TPR) repeat protein
LLVAADAAYADGAYAHALARYGELLSLQDGSPAAAHAAFQVGWIHLREGRRDDARVALVHAAERFPGAQRAPVALLLAAEAANHAGDTTAAKALLDRTITHYPTSVYAGAAKLGRTVLALREQREDAAARDVGDVMRAHGTPAIDARRGIVDALATEAAVETSAPNALAWRTLAVPTDNPLGRFAAALLQAADRETVPYVLHGLSVIGAADRRWSDVTVATLVNRIVEGWPSYPPAPMLLERVASAAATAGQWPVARQAYETLIARYPAAATTARMALAEALVASGAGAEARVHLQHAIAAGGETGARALLLLAQVEETLGNHDASLAAYDRLLREHPRTELPVTNLISLAQRLESSGRADAARLLLERIVKTAEGEVAAEASYHIARILGAQGQDAAAVEWYMAAAYAGAGSRWERPSLLAASQALTALNRTDEALVAYRKATEPAATATPAASPPLGDRRANGDGTDNVSLRLAEALERDGKHDAALDMYLAAAHQTRGQPAASRALLGAIRSFLAVGDPLGAEAIYRRMLESGDTDPGILADARKTIRGAAAR